ncbi:MAG: glycosyltransferase [Bacteroidetes bacterium]|nr:glycosyltransferase [Bacteroidota bacterium]
MKKKILFVYEEMAIGGSTTSLLSILNSIDYTRYDVDLLLYYNQGPLFNQIPKQVNILPQASIYSPSAKFTKITRSILAGDIQRSLYYGFLFERKIKLNMQAMVYARVTNSRIINEKYDAAIGFLESWPNVFVGLKAKAKIKIGWVHCDWKNSHLKPLIEDKAYAKLDYIVSVSPMCRDNYAQVFPKFKYKAAYIENILLQDTIRNKANEYIPDITVDKTKINLISVCRIDFKSKGLDRGVKVFSRLKVDNLIDNFHWYIVGNGHDMNNLRAMIYNNKLDKHITLLGEKSNPLPYVSLMDMIFLPSRYEGKPMAVTEAHMLGIPALVTAYTSANEQIKNGVDGIILENTDDSLYMGLKNLIDKKVKIEEMKKLVFSYDYSNKEVIESIYKMIG